LRCASWQRINVVVPEREKLTGTFARNSLRGSANTRIAFGGGATTALVAQSVDLKSTWLDANALNITPAS